MGQPRVTKEGFCGSVSHPGGKTDSRATFLNWLPPEHPGVIFLLSVTCQQTIGMLIHVVPLEIIITSLQDAETGPERPSDYNSKIFQGTCNFNFSVILTKAKKKRFKRGWDNQKMKATPDG